MKTYLRALRTAYDQLRACDTAGLENWQAEDLLYCLRQLDTAIAAAERASEDDAA